MNRHKPVWNEDESASGPLPEELRAAQLLAARGCIRDRSIRCEVCNTRRTVTGHGRYCSGTCRSRAYRARKRAAAHRTAPDILADLIAALDARNLSAARRFAEELSTNVSM